MAHWLLRLCRHRLFDEGDIRRALPPEALRRIEARVAASEARHSGQIRVCVEAGLPFGYLRRLATARDRAVAMFGKLCVWDTDDNDGVLIYMLLAEKAVEFVADRGLNARVDAAAWSQIASDVTAVFRGGDFEAGLNRAIDAVDALLVRHFPRRTGEDGGLDENELSDAPDLR